jgi:hypothetical protein
MENRRDSDPTMMNMFERSWGKDSEVSMQNNTMFTDSYRFFSDEAESENEGFDLKRGGGNLAMNEDIVMTDSMIEQKVGTKKS